MLDIKILRSDPDVVRNMLTARGGDAAGLFRARPTAPRAPLSPGPRKPA